MAEPVRPYSTKLARPIPPEFEYTFIFGGWAKVNHLFGKRASVRWFTALGAERLSAARDAYRAGPDAWNAHQRARRLA